jgi:alpha-1,2-mannosyltransferase
VLVPVALAAGGHWRAFLAAAATALALTAVSALLFGAPTWTAFLHNAPINARLMEHGVNFWHRMPTVFSAARLMGAGIAASYGAQIVSALGAALLVALVWRTDASLPLRGAVLVFATFLATPYAWDYDLVWLTLAVTWVAMEAVRDGFRPWEKIAIACAVVMPLISLPLAAASHIQIGPLMLWLLLLLTVRRALQPSPHPQARPRRPKMFALHSGA